MLRLKESTLLCSLLLALAGCKVTVNSTSADDARPNPGADATDDPAKAPKAVGGGDEGASEGGEDEGGDDGETTNEPAADPSTTLTSQAPVTCEDGKYQVGDTWKSDCNSCKCSEKGVAMCTRMACEKIE